MLQMLHEDASLESGKCQCVQREETLLSRRLQTLAAILLEAAGGCRNRRWDAGLLTSILDAWEEALGPSCALWRGEGGTMSQVWTEGRLRLGAMQRDAGEDKQEDAGHMREGGCERRREREANKTGRLAVTQQQSCGWNHNAQEHKPVLLEWK